MARSDPAVYQEAPAATREAVRLGVPLRPTSWSAWDALWALLGWLALSTVVGGVLVASGADIFGPAFLVTVLAPWIALAGWPLLVTRRRGNGAVIDLGLTFRKADWKAGLLGGVAAFVVGIVTAAISVALFGDFSSAAADQAQQIADNGGWVVLLLFAVLVVVGAPFAEELAFRGLLWTGLAKRGVKPWICVAVTAAAFAAIHLEPPRLIVLFSIGIVLGIVRWRSGSVGASMIAHAVNNFPAALGLLALPLA